MAKRDTKRLIANEFISRVRATSLAQVRIADLIASLDMNRNTFYYHFTSKYDVAMWVLRTDLADALRNALPERQLISAPVGNGDTKEVLPYFTHVEVGARTLDSSAFLQSMAGCVLKDPSFYRKLFTIRETEFSNLITALWQPAFYDDISFMLGGRPMNDSVHALLAFTSVRNMQAVIEYILEHEREAATFLDEDANPFWGFINESLRAAIQQHPISRPRTAR